MEDEAVMRLQTLENRVADQDLRIQALEARFRPTATTASPPVQPFTTPREAAREAPVIRPPAAHDDCDAEYQIGAKVLPKIGAGVLVVAFAYLVGLAVSQGRITPAMVWWGINALALVFIGFGHVKRGEREQFGQILTAIGSAGMFLNFAGGFEFQKLYSAETLLMMFLSLSAANLAYALWRSSKAFLAIGLVGGLIAAVMPLDHSNFLASSVLAFIVVLWASVIAAKNKWMTAFGWIGALSAIVLLLLLLPTYVPAEWQIGTTMVVGLTLALCYGWAFKPNTFDPKAVWGGVALLAVAVVSILTKTGPAGSLWILGFSAIAFGAAFLLIKDAQPRSSLIGGAVLTSLWVAPFGLIHSSAREPYGPGFWILLAVSGVTAVASKLGFSKLLSIAGAGALGLALAVYSMSDAGQRLPYEIAIVCVLLFLTALLSWSSGRAAPEQRAEIYVIGCWIGWGLIWRLGQLALVQSSVRMNADAATTASYVATAVGLMGLGFALKLRELRWMSFIVTGATIVKVFFVDLSTLDSGTRVAVLMLLGMAMLGGGYLYIRVHGRAKLTE